MDYRSLTALALRVAGVLVIVNTVSGLPKLILDTVSMATSTAAVNGFSMTPYIAIMGGAVLASLVIGLALIMFPGSLAVRIVGVEAPAAGSEPAFHRLQALTFTGIGLYLLATGMVSFLSRAFDIYIEYRYFLARYSDQVWSIGSGRVVRLVGDGLFAAGGLAIILGASGLSRLINRVRGYSWDEA